MEREFDEDPVYGRYPCKKFGGGYMVELTVNNLNEKSLALIVVGLEEFRKTRCKGCPPDCPTRKVDELLNAYRSGLKRPVK